MAKVIFQDEQGQNLNRYVLTPVEGQTNTYDLTRAATITQQGTPYSKEIGDHFLQVEDGAPAQTLACAKTDTVYALTGLSATSGKVPVLFAADSAYAAGDTVTIDGTAYTLATRDGSALTAGAWAAGAIISSTADVDNKVLTVEPSAPVGSRSATWMPNATDVGALAWNGILNNPDLNTLLTPGSYYIQGCTNGPAPFGFLDVKQGYTSAYLLQVFYDISTHCMFTRKYQNATFETSWALLSGGFLILNKSDTIPTGLADNTIVLRKQS